MHTAVREERQDHRRVAALVVVSLGLHVGAALFLSGRPPPAPGPRTPMRLESLAWTEVAPEPEPEPEPATTPPEQRPRPTPLQKKKNQPVAERPQVTAETPAAGSGEGGGEDLPSSNAGLPGGATRDGARPSLLPSEAFAMSLGTGGVSEAVRGTTITNRPDELPDQEAVNAYNADKIQRRLNTELRQHVGAAAIAVGNVPGHFKNYQRAMRGALPAANIEMSPFAGQFAADVLLGSMTAPSAQASRKVADSAMGRAIMNGTGSGPNAEDQRFREAGMQMMAFGEGIRERVQSVRLRTVLEMTTDATGALADVSIVEKSGDPKFDESVLHFSRKVARKLPDSDDKMLGSTWWKSLWQFTFEPPDVRVRLLNAWRVEGEPTQLQ